MPRRRHILSLIARISVALPAFAAENSFDGTYTGKRMLTKGDPIDCTAKDDPVSIVIHGNQLTFTNSRATSEPLTFDPQPDGTFGQLSLNDDGVVVAIRGHIGDGLLDSDAVGAKCTYHWHLEKEH